MVADSLPDPLLQIATDKEVGPVSPCWGGLECGFRHVQAVQARCGTLAPAVH